MLPAQFHALVQSLGLTQGLFKPLPTSSLNVSQNSFQSTRATQDTGVQQPNAVQQAYNSTVWTNSSSPETVDSAQDPCYVQPYFTPPPVDIKFEPFDEARATIYRFRQQQSVNLGSWFVHEPWMTPSLFRCASGAQASEIDIAYGWGSPESARTVLERHWDTFITQADFNYLASIGINTVRLPIGYWSLGPGFTAGTPFEFVSEVYRNAWPRVVRAINMAGKAGIGVVVDLHGAVGSQNGQPHSGISDGQINLFNNPANVALTIRVLVFLIERLVYVTNVVGIQILNEPVYGPELENFYTDAIAAMRLASRGAADFPLYLHNGFDLERFTRYISARTDFVVQDHHSYFVFTPGDASAPAGQHTINVGSGISESLGQAAEQSRRNLVVDEWSCALTSDSLSNEADPDSARREFCTGQQEVYTNQTAGWSFWSYMKEDCTTDPGWCFHAAVGTSLPSKFFSYGKVDLTDPATLKRLADLIQGMNPPSLSDILHQRSIDVRNAHGHLLDKRFGLLHAHRGLAKRQGTTLSQPAVLKGYSDGFLTAKIFAMYQMSKLGFTGQYIANSLQALGNEVVLPGTEEDYKHWFMNGLRDGEKVVGTLGF